MVQQVQAKELHMKLPNKPQIRVPQYMKRAWFWVIVVLIAQLTFNNYMLYTMSERLPQKAPTKSAPAAKAKR
jgi:hypothetical protein